MRRGLFRSLRNHQGAARRRTFVPHAQFELLEDRWMLTAVSWIGGAAGNWDVAANWSNDAIPASAADVTMSTVSSATITIKTGDVESVHSLTIGSMDALSIVGGSLTTALGLSNSGTVSVAAGCSLTVNGNYSQAAGATLSLPGGGSMANPTTNFVTNSAFESPVAANTTTMPSSWGAWGSSYLSTQYAFTGAQSLRISGANSGVVESFAATPGASYTVSADAMTPASDPLTGNETGQMELLFFNSSGTLLNSYSAPNAINVLTGLSATGGPLAGSVGGQGWNHFSTTAVAPSNTTEAEAIITTQIYTGTGGGSVFWDDVQFGPSVPGSSAFAAANMSNSGTITVGPSNTVSIGGTFTQTSSGTLDIQLGGSPSSGAFGFVNVSGTATLAGTLKSDLVYGYTPATTDSFTPLEFARESGAFSKYSLPSGSTYQLAGAVSFTNVVISAAPVMPVISNINAGVSIGAAATNLLGINLAYWDDQEGTAQTQQLVQAAGLNLYRFPGGSASDDFHFNVSNNYGDSAANSIPQFAQSISAVGGMGMVTLDYGSGSPQEAAAELAYLQGSTSDTTAIGTGLQWNDSTNQWQGINWRTVGYWASLRTASPLATDDGLNFMRIAHAAPFTDIKYWEIGNEEYGSWEVDHHGTLVQGGGGTGSQHDPATYAAFAEQFARQATEILGAAGLPAISIGIDSGDPTGTSDNNWTKNTLADGLSIGFVPGFISDHSYMQAPGAENDSFLLNDSVSDPNSILDWSTRYADYSALLQQTLSSQASSVVVMATEFNSVYTNPGKQSTSLVNGLFIANSIGSLLDSGYQAAMVWDLRNSWDTSQNNSNLLYGWREGGDYGKLGDPNDSNAPFTGANIAYPGYYALQLASKIDAGGGQVVSATSNDGGLDVYAVKESNGHLALLVINTNPAASLTDQFNLTGFQPSASAQIWQYGEAQDTAQSLSTDGSSALANSTATLNVSGGSFNYTFPAYSMTVLDLASAPMISLTSGAGSGAPNYTTTWYNQGSVPIENNVLATVTALSGVTTLSSLKVTLATFHTGDVLSLAPLGGVSLALTSSYSAGTLTLSGTDTVAHYQQALRFINYNNTAGDPGTTPITATFLANDGTLTSAPVTATINISVGSGQVLGNRLFYNNSKYDGNNGNIAATDDAAIASDKTGYNGTGTATFANVSSFNKGITGIMVDLQSGIGTHTAITAGDISFKVSPTTFVTTTYNQLSTWSAGPSPSAVSVRIGVGQGGSDRLEITFGTGVVKNEWLEVDVHSGAPTRVSWSTTCSTSAASSVTRARPTRCCWPRPTAMTTTCRSTTSSA